MGAIQGHDTIPLGLRKLLKDDMRGRTIPARRLRSMAGMAMATPAHRPMSGRAICRRGLTHRAWRFRAMAG